jgi:hypothetical protein
MRHLGPKGFRSDRAGRNLKERKCPASIYTRTPMHTIRLHRAGLLRQLTAPTPGCANRLIHQSAVGKQPLSFGFRRTLKQKSQCITKRRPPLLSRMMTCSVRVLRTLEPSLAPPQKKPPPPPQPTGRTRFRHVGDSIPWKGLRASMSSSNSCRVGLASNLPRRLRNRSVTRLGDISSIWLRHGPSSSG